LFAQFLDERARFFEVEGSKLEDVHVDEGALQSEARGDHVEPDRPREQPAHVAIGLTQIA
jgi:hypothetical protein